MQIQDKIIPDQKIAVINLIGRVDMNVLSENPFVIVKEIIENIQKEVGRQYESNWNHSRI